MRNTLIIVTGPHRSGKTRTTELLWSGILARGGSAIIADVDLSYAAIVSHAERTGNTVIVERTRQPSAHELQSLKKTFSTITHITTGIL